MINVKFFLHMSINFKVIAFLVVEGLYNSGPNEDSIVVHTASTSQPLLTNPLEILGSGV
jgi:hypothetical protein